ncbi:MAG: DegV family protein [Lachnospiraceae bacterium]|nr:DegV family protein [Lachnospiraceae bacterium]
MPKIAIVTDTNSGMTIAEGKENGISVLPMPLLINGQEYLDDVNLTHEEFYRFLAQGANVSTSQPAAGDVMSLWEELLEKYDEIVHIPMSSGLSGACANAKIYAEDFDGRVFVVDNQRISVTQRQSVYDAKALAEKGYSGADIKRILEETKFDSSIYIMLDTLEYLKKGGRITPAAAAFAKILNLKPILQIQGEKLDAFSKCRGIKQAKSIMIRAIQNDIEHRFGGLDLEHPSFFIQIAHTQNDATAEEFKQELLSVFPGFPFYVDRLPLSISCHIGPGSLACAISKFLPQLADTELMSNAS